MKKSQFKIEQKLNESGTTVVYKAFDEVLHRNVLLKVLHKHLANDDELRQRFVREARACAALQSEHIVQVYDLTEIDGAPAIVMEFIEGRDDPRAKTPIPTRTTRPTAPATRRPTGDPVGLGAVGAKGEPSRGRRMGPVVGWLRRWGPVPAARWVAVPG